MDVPVREDPAASSPPSALPVDAAQPERGLGPGGETASPGAVGKPPKPLVTGVVYMIESGERTLAQAREYTHYGTPGRFPPDYDASAATLLKRRVLEFLKGVE